MSQGGKIDSFGVGERLITAKSDPVFGAVYKISAVEENGVFEPRIKISETVEKITNPGNKQVYRIYSSDNKAVADLITNFDEEVNLSKPYRFIDPEKPWKVRYFENCIAKPMKELVLKEGKRLYAPVPLKKLQNFVKEQLTNEIWEEEQRFSNPHIHYVDMSPKYYEMKMNLLSRLSLHSARNKGELND